jgi:hypothetical protein
MRHSSPPPYIYRDTHVHRKEKCREGSPSDNRRWSEGQLEEKTRAEDSRHQLVWHGMVLFLLRLLTGFVEQNFANARMGLAAHLEGVMNGTFLVALGAIWATVRLSPRWKRAAYWSALYGTYANWAVTLLAAIFGTAAMF